MRFAVRQGERTLFDATIEHVVTDADPEYTGWQVGTVEQAMQRTMADSLRVVLGDLLRRLDAQLAPELAVRRPAIRNAAAGGNSPPGLARRGP
jgi:hypothetical protein